MTDNDTLIVEDILGDGVRFVIEQQEIPDEGADSPRLRDAISEAYRAYFDYQDAIRHLTEVAEEMRDD